MRIGAKVSFWDVAILITPFTSGLFYRSPVGHLYAFYVIKVAYLVTYAVTQKQLIIPKNFIWVLLLIVVSSIIGNLVFSISPQYIMLRLPPMMLAFLCYYTFIQSYNFDTELILQKYFTVAFYVALLGFAQQAAHLLGIDILMPWAAIIKSHFGLVGVVGFSSEPSNLAVALAPAVYYALHKILYDRRLYWRALVVLGCMLLSLSALGYMAMFIALLMLSRVALGRNRILFFALMLPVGLGLYTLAAQDFFVMRILQTFGVFSGRLALLPHDINLSTYTLMVNYDIVKRAFLDNYMIGTGLGSYYETFQNYISGYRIPNHLEQLPGSHTASSFVLKVTAEFGLLGLITIIFLTVRFYSTSAMNIANRAFFLALVVIYLRMGMYYINGIPFVILMYIYSYGYFRRSAAQRVAEA